MNCRYHVVLLHHTGSSRVSFGRCFHELYLDIFLLCPCWFPSSGTLLPYVPSSPTASESPSLYPILKRSLLDFFYFCFCPLLEKAASTLLFYMGSSFDGIPFVPPTPSAFLRRFSFFCLFPEFSQRWLYLPSLSPDILGILFSTSSI